MLSDHQKEITLYICFEVINIPLNKVLFLWKEVKLVFVAKWVFSQATVHMLLSTLFKYTREHLLPPAKFLVFTLV